MDGFRTFLAQAATRQASVGSHSEYIPTISPVMLRDATSAIAMRGIAEAYDRLAYEQERRWSGDRSKAHLNGRGVFDVECH
jgi:hypothetical protein